MKNENRTTSDRQRAANRVNASKSTGPVTFEGKAKSAMNAYTHGLTAKDHVITGELQPVFDSLKAAFFARFQPIDETEADAVSDIVKVRWHIRRIRGIEDAALEIEMQDPLLTERFEYASEGVRITLAYRNLADNSNILRLANRQLARLGREYQRLVDAFFDLRLKAPPQAGAQQPAAPQPAEPAPESDEKVQNEPIPINEHRPISAQFQYKPIAKQSDTENLQILAAGASLDLSGPQPQSIIPAASSETQQRLKGAI